MTDRVKLIIFSIIALAVVLYINNRINAYDMRFYSGKDGGDFVRLESICLLSSLFYLLMDSHIWILRIIIGFAIGLLSSIIGFIVSEFFLTFFSTTGLIFHVIGCITFVLLFYVIRDRDQFKQN